MHLTDGLTSNNKLNPICLHHEQAVAMAVDGYARATENLGVGYFTTGPGVTNALTGLAGAWQDSVPALYISGQVKRSETTHNAKILGLRQFGVQEINVIPLVESICKYAVVLNDAEKIRYELEKSVYIARSGRPGPVWLDVPMDVQATKVDPDSLKGFEPPVDSLSFPEDQVDMLVSLLKKSQRPVIIAGRGIRLAGARDILAQFAKAFKVPIVTPFLGIDNINHNREEFIGKTGVKGDRAANYAMQNSDLILSIGSSLHVTVTGYEYDLFAREAIKVVVDIDETAHKKKTIDINLFIKADAKDFLDKLDVTSNKIGLPDYSNWLDQCNLWKGKYKVCLPEYADTKDAINIYSFVDQLSIQATEGDVFVTDTGSAFYAVAQGIQLTKPGQRYITSGGMCTMGFSLPAAIGISIALNRKRVLSINGDGSLQQNIQELQTLVHHNLPVKIFVLSNDGYLSIRQSQKNYFSNRFIGESPESGVSFPDIVKVANAYGIPSFRVNNLDKLEKVIEEVFEIDGPVICDVIAPREQLIIPTLSSRVNKDGSMSSRPLEDMLPFLDREEYFKNLYIKDV